jgi:hypothetical protein
VRTLRPVVQLATAEEPVDPLVRGLAADLEAPGQLGDALFLLHVLVDELLTLLHE